MTAIRQSTVNLLSASLLALGLVMTQEGLTAGSGLKCRSKNANAPLLCPSLQLWLLVANKDNAP